MLFNLLRPRWEPFVVVWREVPLPGGVLQLDSHAGVEEETEEEVQYWVTRDIEVGANLWADDADATCEHHVEDPAKHVGAVHCQL